mgnify:FL=1
MRYIRYASIAIFGLALVLIALANRNLVTLRVLPDELAGFAALNPTYELPLFVVIFGGIALVFVLLIHVWFYCVVQRHLPFALASLETAAAFVRRHPSSMALGFASLGDRYT